MFENIFSSCLCESKNPENLIKIISQPNKNIVRFKCMEYGHNVDIDISDPFIKLYDEYNLTRICDHDNFKLLERFDDNYLCCRICSQKIDATRECRCYFDPSYVKISDLQSLDNTTTYDCIKCGRNFSKCNNWDDNYVSKTK